MLMSFRFTFNFSKLGWKPIERNKNMVDSCLFELKYLIPVERRIVLTYVVLDVLSVL